MINNNFFLHGPQYDQIKPHSFTNDPIVEKRRKTDKVIANWLAKGPHCLAHPLFVAIVDKKRQTNKSNAFGGE